MELIHYAFTAVLIAVLVAASVTFVFMGMGKVRRRRRLARQAHVSGLKFFPDDPYDVPRRYADFAVISSGHSPRANNVTAGSVGPGNVRLFDFRCELGHGTSRLTRRYSVAVAEAEKNLDHLLMWHGEDADLAPLAARNALARVGAWSYHGSARLARALGAVCNSFADAQLSIEVRGPVVLIASPVKRAVRHHAIGLDRLAEILVAMESCCAGAFRKEPNQPVANGGPSC